MLDQRRGQWANNKTLLAQCVFFAWNISCLAKLTYLNVRYYNDDDVVDADDFFHIPISFIWHTIIKTYKPNIRVGVRRFH